MPLNAARILLSAVGRCEELDEAFFQLNSPPPLQKKKICDQYGPLVQFPWPAVKI